MLTAYPTHITVDARKIKEIQQHVSETEQAYIAIASRRGITIEQFHKEFENAKRKVRRLKELWKMEWGSDKENLLRERMFFRKDFYTLRLNGGANV